MARLSFIALLSTAVLATLGSAAPIQFKASSSSSSSAAKASSTASASSASSSSSASAGSFQLLDYADFQISDGVAGDAEAEANAVFVDPFDGVDLASVDETTLDNIQTMREAAEDAETEKFNSAIEAASGDEADALQVGKIKNKVLKLTGEIAQAGGDTADLEDKLAEEQKKLDTNIATDKKSAGATSQSVV
ncbi:hypothetical protein K523DRAFT_346802 [Schizophyllum commune Tattone D]|nr:hypothetical protein K523DRAFT_346802 [Schizophyllum commune Tattone D]